MRTEVSPQGLIFEIKPLGQAMAIVLNQNPIRDDFSRTGEGTTHHFAWTENLAMAAVAILDKRATNTLSEEERNTFFAQAIETALAMQVLNIIEVKGLPGKRVARLNRKFIPWLSSF